MAKQIKIKSAFLTPLNEALQKLKLNDTVTDFTPVIVEADGKFTSVVNAKEEFNPNDLGSSFETEDVKSEEQKETKEQLLNKAKDALKQTLTNSKELNDILQKIQDLSKESGYNTWEVNKHHNTATLKSKNAAIFKQNNNLCLSHGGKIELFHSVQELRNWLKDKGYPLPGDDVVIHESVEIKEDGRNWVDLLNGYNDKKKADAISAELDSNNNISDILRYETNIKIVNEYDDLFRRKSDLEKQLTAYEAKIKVASRKIPEKLSPKEAFDAGNITEEDYEAFEQASILRKDIEKIEKAAKRFYKDNNLDAVIPAVNEYKRSFNRGNKMMNSLGKPIPKEILQAANRQKPEVKFNRSYLEKDTDVEECCGGACVGTAALGPAVAYTASPKKKKEENVDLQEAFTSLIPGDTKMYPGKRELVNKFLTWYKRNKAAVESGEIKLPEDMENIFDTVIEPTYLNNSSDSVSRVWKNIVEKRLTPLAAKIATAKNIPEKKALVLLMSKPNQQICDLLSTELNTYIPEEEDYQFGKVQLIPNNSIVDVKTNNPNYQQRQNWQKAYYQAKNGGVIDQTEAMVKTFNDFKRFIKKPKVDVSQYTPEELELIKKYGLGKIQTESVIFESAKKYPWLNKILGQRLVEDDSPADFATGSPISSDMGSADTANTSATTSSTSTTSDTSVDTPDIDLGGGSTGTDSKPSFGDINIDAGGYSPDEGEDAAPMPIDMPEYKIIDVLMNDDNNDIKVKVQNTDTKETEVKDLEDIDV